MSLAEAKTLFGTLIFGSFAITLFILAIASKIAEITYKKAHKNVKKVHKKASKNVNIVFDIDSKGKTLQEVQAERNLMMKGLIGNV